MHDAVKPTATASAPATSGPITGTISTRPANAPTRSQYGSPIAQKSSESAIPTSHDQQHLPAHERAEPQVDQRPRVAHQLALRSRDQRADDVDRLVALEDPVGGGGEA